MVDIWNRKIPRADKSLSIKYGVCELHFIPRDIITSKVHKQADDSEIVYPFIRPRLESEAVPYIFPNLPPYLSCENLKKRKPPLERMTILQEKSQILM